MKFLHLFVLPMILVIILSSIAVILKSDLAALISYGGMTFVLLGNLGYIVFFDSRKHWPNRSWLKRLAMVLTFQE